MCYSSASSLQGWLLETVVAGVLEVGGASEKVAEYGDTNRISEVTVWGVWEAAEEDGDTSRCENSVRGRMEDEQDEADTRMEDKGVLDMVVESETHVGKDGRWTEDLTGEEETTDGRLGTDVIVE